MTQPTLQESPSLPVFEIDLPDDYGQFLLTNPREIAFYLQLFARQHSIFTVYIDDGKCFFLSTLLAFDESAELIFIDPPRGHEITAAVLSAQRITLVTSLDRVKMQIRLKTPKELDYQGKATLGLPFPRGILRLQRREFFRLEPVQVHPIHCRLAKSKPDGSNRLFDLTLSDISGGGLCLKGATTIRPDFARDDLFRECRLDIPEEGVIIVDLRVRKIIEISSQDGEHSLRIGCEFINLPGTRLAVIERYIARIERERKARESGLAD